MKKIMTAAAITAAILSLSACEPQTTKQSDAIIYFGGNIITMEGETPHYIEALVIDGGIIRFAGDIKSAKKQYANAQQKDLKGTTMLPGFIDGHVHFGGLGAQAVGANLLAGPDGEVDDIDALISTLQEWSKGEYAQKGGWIFGMGYDNAVLKENRHPTKFDLDKVSTEVPVVAVHISGHFAAMNSVGLEKMGITEASINPAGGIIRRVADSQEPNGVLEELAAIPNYMKAISPISEEEQTYFLDNAQQLAMSFGYTTVQDGRTFGSSHDSLVNYANTKGFKIDVVSYLDYSMKDENVQGFACASNGAHIEEDEHGVKDYSNLTSPWSTGSYVNGYRVAGMKITLDGSPQGRTAWSNTPYSIAPEGQEDGYKGYPAIPNDEDAQALYELAFKNNWQVLTHTNGDAAIDQMLRTMKPAAEKYGNEDRRSVLIHGVFLQKRQYAEMKNLKIIPSMFTMHTFYWGDWYKEIIGEERAQQIAPAKSLIDAGFNITIHTDAPVALPNLMQIVWASVNRVSRSGTVMGPDERISPYEALKAITIWSAHQHFEEDKKGSLAVGKLADLVILSDNPLTIDPMKINQIKVIQTLKDGESVYHIDQ